MSETNFIGGEDFAFAYQLEACVSEEQAAKR